jgi:hypothetical protein
MSKRPTMTLVYLPGYAGRTGLKARHQPMRPAVRQNALGYRRHPFLSLAMLIMLIGLIFLGYLTS